MWIETLKISSFRNITAATIQVPPTGAFAIVGENGAGKTSVLEALSLLTPGRGIHRAKLDTITQYNQSGWGIFAALKSGGDDHTLGMQYVQKKKQILLNGAPLTSLTPLAELGSVVWFTPEMDRLFFDGPAARRRFLDRLVFGLFPAHAEALSRYTHHLQSRARLLKEDGDTDWITLEEKQAAHWGVRVVQARQSYLSAVEPYLTDVCIAMQGQAEKSDAQDTETAFREAFYQNRSRDKRFNSTHFGPHRTEVTGTLLDGSLDLSEASMGQHKRALMHLLIGHSTLIKAQTGQPPCLLLDEATAHLDATNRTRLFGQLLALGGQVWLTGTDKDMFATLDTVQFLEASAGNFTWTMP